MKPLTPRMRILLMNDPPVARVGSTAGLGGDSRRWAGRGATEAKDKDTGPAAGCKTSLPSTRPGQTPTATHDAGAAAPPWRRTPARRDASVFADTPAGPRTRLRSTAD